LFAWGSWNRSQVYRCTRRHGGMGKG